MGCALGRPQHRLVLASSSAAAERRLNDQLGERLSAKQIALVRGTWAAVSQDMAGTGALVFSRLFQTDTAMRSLFKRLMSKPAQDDRDSPPPVDEPDREMLEKHGAAVMQALGAAVDCLDDALMLNSVLLALGQAHCSFGVRPEHVMRLWPAIDYALQHRLGDQLYTRAARKAWHRVYCHIAHQMMLGLQMRRALENSNGRVASA